MNGILIAVLIVTGLLIYKIISSSRKQEGYKRWKATGSGNTTNEETSKNKWEHGTWLRHALGVVTPKMRTCPVFDEEAVVWCANLLGIEVMRLKEILQDVSSHYREFWIRKRRGGYRMISAPDKELKAIQDTIYHRILLSVNVHPAATGFRRQHSIVDNVRPHLGKRCVLKTDIHDFFISIRSPRVKKTFEKIGYPKNISKVLGELCCMRRHLPQGASTSPVLSNIIELWDSTFNNLSVDDDPAQALLHSPARQPVIHGRRMSREPPRELGSKAANHGGVAARQSLSHVREGLQYCGVLVDMASRRGVSRACHQAIRLPVHHLLTLRLLLVNALLLFGKGSLSLLIFLCEIHAQISLGLLSS